MINLLKKNILLNKTNIILGILASFFFAAITLDGYKYYPVSLLMCPSLLFSFIVGKMCYMEDSISTRQFLLALPISKRDIIFEKNILSYICTVLGLFIATLGAFINSKLINTSFHFDINIIITMVIFLIIYNTVYLILNYKFDYSKAQQLTPYILLLSMFAIFKFGNKLLTLLASSSTLILLFITLIIVSLNHIILITLCKTLK